MFITASNLMNISELNLMGVVKESIDRFLVENIEDEATYPQQFSMDEFKKMTSFRQREQYCNQKLYRLASGSARIVYAIDDKTVLKLAKNTKGIVQNGVEVNGYREMSSMGYDFIAEVYEHDDRMLWLEMELAGKLRPTDFMRIYNIPFKFYQQFILWTHKQYSTDRYVQMRHFDWTNDQFVEALENNEDGLLGQIYSYLTNYCPDVVGDLTRISSYGKVNRNGKDEIILIDYGLDDDTYNSYYKR